MDQLLDERLRKWHEAILALEGVERVFLSLESNEKPLYSSLFLESLGKTVAEREANVYVEPKWHIFQKGLVESKVSYLKEKRLLELNQAAFQSAYLGVKVSGEAIQKYPRGMT